MFQKTKYSLVESHPFVATQLKKARRKVKGSNVRKRKKRG